MNRRARAALDNKLEVLVTGEAPPTLFRGPVRLGNKTYRHTYKLTVDCGIALRPLACRGPFAINDEWTILVPVIEVGNRYDPGDFQQAEDRRNEVIEDSNKRRVFRDKTFYE